MPQVIIKKTGQIIIDFYNLISEMPLFQNFAQEKVLIRLNCAEVRISKEMYGCLNGDKINEITRKLIDGSIKNGGVNIVISENSKTKSFNYLKKVINANIGNQDFKPATEIIGQGNLNEFYVGKQCALCEVVQGDLGLLPRLRVYKSFLAALNPIQKFKQQVSDNVKKMQAFEVASEAMVLKLARQRKMGILSVPQQNKVEAKISYHQYANLQKIKPLDYLQIKDPLVRYFTKFLTHASQSDLFRMNKFLQVYVGRHLLDAIAKYGEQYEYDFMVGWLDSDLVQEVYRRLVESRDELWRLNKKNSEKNDEQDPMDGRCLPIEFAIDLWPIFMQYYTASILAISCEELSENEIKKLLKTFQQYMPSIEENKLWEF